MKFNQPHSRMFVPDRSPAVPALRRTTHLGIGAHPDDLESIAIRGITAAYSSSQDWFSGVVLTNGSGAPRAEKHHQLSDREYIHLRAEEQIQAARIGRYSAVVLLDYSSEEIQRTKPDRAAQDLEKIISTANPDIIYTHNPFDNHPTHVAVFDRVLAVLKSQPAASHPNRLVGMEMWGSLEWLPEEYRLEFDTTACQDLQEALLRAFPSQNTVKDYPAALLGRRKANATLSQPDLPDSAEGVIFGLDLTPLLQETDLTTRDYLTEILRVFRSQKLESTNS